MIAPYPLEPCAACSGDRSADASATYRMIERLASAISRARLIARTAARDAAHELDYRRCARCGAICATGALPMRAISGAEASAKLAALKRLLAVERRRPAVRGKFIA